jgi:spore germination protein YaaH
MALALADPASRAQHVQTIVAWCSSRGSTASTSTTRSLLADDRTTWDTTRPNWVAFMAELAGALHAEGKLLTVAVPPIYDTDRTADSGSWVYDYAAMSEHVDQIRIMAYDYSTDRPGPIAPVDWVRSVVRAAKDAVDDDSKLVLGVPLYGRNWVVGTTGTCPADAPGKVDPNQREVDALLAQYAATPQRDEATQEATFTYQRESSDGATSCTQTREVHYVDAAGVRARVDVARDERIGGVVFWALGYGTDAAWAAVAEVARPRAVELPVT